MEVLRKYGAGATIIFPLVDRGTQDLEIAATFAAGDVVIMKDEGAEANTTNLPTDEGTGYSLVLTATEMQAARIAIYIIDQTATKVWEDQAIIISTYGNASAQHAVDLDDGVRAGLTALPNAAADAAGGLPISDLGGLDLDAILVDTAALNDTKIPDTISLAAINAEVVDALATDTYTEPGQGAPPATASLSTKINHLYKSWRNKKEQTATEWRLFDDAGTTVDSKATVSDAAGLTTKEEIASGP